MRPTWNQSCSILLALAKVLPKQCVGPCSLLILACLIQRKLYIWSMSKGEFIQYRWNVYPIWLIVASPGQASNSIRKLEVGCVQHKFSPDIENIHVLLKYTKIYQSTTFLNSGRLPDFFLAFCAFLPAFCGYVWWCFSREMSEVCVCLPDLKILPPNEDG